MNIRVKKGDLAETATEAAVVTHFEGEEGLSGVTEKLDGLYGGLPREIISR